MAAPVSRPSASLPPSLCPCTGLTSQPLCPGTAVNDLHSLFPTRFMGSACASTTLQDLTASTVPRSTTTALGRLLMAKLEPPESVSVRGQLTCHFCGWMKTRSILMHLKGRCAIPKCGSAFCLFSINNFHCFNKSFCSLWLRPSMQV